MQTCSAIKPFRMHVRTMQGLAEDIGKESRFNSLQKRVMVNSVLLPVYPRRTRRTPANFSDRIVLLQEIHRLGLEIAALVEEVHQLQAATDMYQQVLARLAERDRSVSTMRQAAIR